MKNGEIGRARKCLAGLVRSHREDRLGLSRTKVCLGAGIAKKVLCHLEHASPRQVRYEIEIVIRHLFKLGDREHQWAYDLLNICFPDADAMVKGITKIPSHLHHFFDVFCQRNKPRIFPRRKFPRKVRARLVFNERRSFQQVHSR